MVRRLRDAEARRAVVVAELAQTDGLIIGSLSEVQRRCGKPSCHCAERPGHPQTILMSVQEGRRRCQLIRQADLAAVRHAVERYQLSARAYFRLLKVSQTIADLAGRDTISTEEVAEALLYRHNQTSS